MYLDKPETTLGVWGTVLLWALGADKGIWQKGDLCRLVVWKDDPDGQGSA